MENIIQDSNIKLVQTKKTVEWLIKNTSVSVFDPVSFKGYQRSIDNKHCEKIVNYLLNSFWLPTSVICAISGAYKDDSILRIVDGQHRINAFKMLKDQYKERYEEIKNKELSVIVLEDVSEKIEIDTFITINKASKKVDTSLALVLKNKINNAYSSDDMQMPKRDYIAVEMAWKLNHEDFSALWYDKILFEGNPRMTKQIISLNAFVKSTRVLLRYLEKYHVIEITWNTKEEIDKCINELCELLECIWKQVERKWPVLFDGDVEKRRIIQGAIGYSAINRYLVYRMQEDYPEFSTNNIQKYISNWIGEINIPSDYWETNGYFSQFSSEAGYSIVAKELLRSID